MPPIFTFLQRMKCKHCFGLCLVFVLLFCALGNSNLNSNSNGTVPTYVIKRDFFTLFKAHGFSIYDGTEKDLLYRLDSKFAFSQTMEMIDQHSNETIAKLTSAFFTLLYRANITIFDSNTNQWIQGNIRRLFTVFFDNYVIEWNAQKIIMQTTWNPYVFRFYNQTETGPVMATVHKRLFSSLWHLTYDLDIVSDQLPAAVYIFAIVARDYEHSKSSSSSSSSGKSRKLKIN